MLTRLLHRSLQRLGLDVKRYVELNDPRLLRRRLFERLGIATCIDGGANRGEYALELRRHGFRGTIHSFEPRPEACEALGTRAARDPRWQIHQLALGERAQVANLRVSANGVSSSLLPPTEELRRVVPRAVETHAIEVPVIALEDRWPDLIQDDGPVFLKLDLQGAEERALRGLGARIHDLAAIEVEVPLRPLYEGCWDLPQACAFMANHGLAPISLAPNSFDAETASMFEVNAIFLAQPRWQNHTKGAPCVDSPSSCWPQP